MAAKILSVLKFTNLSSVQYDFLGSSHNAVRRFSPSASVRGQDRPKMQMHGAHPHSAVFGSLVIAHEGLLTAPGGNTAAMMADRDTMLNTILGDLTLAPSGTKLGTLTVQYESWAQTASGDVTLDDYDAELNVDTFVTLPYRFGWRLFKPYLVGNSDGATFYL